MDNMVTDVPGVAYKNDLLTDFINPFGYGPVGLTDNVIAQKLNERNCEYFHKPHLAIVNFANTMRYNYHSLNHLYTIAHSTKKFTKMLQPDFVDAFTSISKHAYEGAEAGADDGWTVSTANAEAFKFVSMEDEFLDVYLEKANSVACALYSLTTWIGISRYILRHQEYHLENLHNLSPTTNFQLSQTSANLSTDIVNGLKKKHFNESSKEFWNTRFTGILSYLSGCSSNDASGEDELPTVLFATLD